ncbi:hypothetical protein [Nitrosopumilus cobalaminigenes]|nr:hypothetical protein [Nitrosopumilus cobalaminigenes]
MLSYDEILIEKSKLAAMYVTPESDRLSGKFEYLIILCADTTLPEN